MGSPNKVVQYSWYYYVFQKWVYLVYYLCRHQPGRDRFCWAKVSEDFWSQSNIFQSWWELSVCQSNLQPSSLEIFSLGNTNFDFTFTIYLNGILRGSDKCGNNHYYYKWLVSFQDFHYSDRAVETYFAPPIVQRSTKTWKHSSNHQKHQHHNPLRK